MIKIKRVRALDNHLLECLFENNEIVIYDMAYVLEQDTPMLDPLKNESFFLSQRKFLSVFQFHTIFVMEMDSRFDYGVEVDPDGTGTRMWCYAASELTEVKP